MTFKHGKLDDSETMQNFLKLAHEKGLIQNKVIEKTASVEKKLDLTVTADLRSNLLKLCSGLRANGLNEYAEELEAKYAAYIKESVNVEKIKYNELLQQAHPKSTVLDVDGKENIVETLEDVQKRMLEIVKSAGLKKKAQLGIRDPKGMPPAPAPITAPITAPKASIISTGSRDSSLNNVKEMQQIIRDISTSIGEKSKTYSTTGNTTTPNQNQNITAFNDFIVENYMNKDSVAGKEVNATPNPVYDKSINDNPMRVLSLALAGLDRTGDPKNNFKADGYWGPRTNNALRNLHAYANSIIGVIKELGVENKGFSDADLNVIEQNILTGGEKEILAIPLATKDANATKLIPTLTKLKSFLTTGLDSIMKDPILITYIEGRKHTIIDPAKKDRFKLTKQDQDQLEQIKNEEVRGPIENAVYKLKMPISNGNKAGAQYIHLKDLLSVDDFKLYAKSMGVNVDNPADLNRFLDQFRKKFNISSTTPVEESQGQLTAAPSK